MKQKKKNIRASLTVEACLVFPLFFFAVMALCCIFRYLYTEYTVEKCMLNTARYLGRFPEIVSAAAEKRSDLAESLLGSMADKEIPVTGMTVAQIADRASDSIVIKGIFDKEISRYPYAYSAVKNESRGFSCLGSVLYSDDETVLIKCSYCLKSPVSLFGLGSIPVSQELEYRYFTGCPDESCLEEESGSEEETEDVIVYITEEKIVYHRSLTCPSLNLVISSCALTEVGNKRNKGGGKYYPCEICAKGKPPQTVYISKDGDRYHYKRKCSGLKRTITEIGLREASKTRRACKRCGKIKEN